MGQHHNPDQNSQDNRRDEHAKKAQKGSGKEQEHGMPGTFKNDPDAKAPKSKSPGTSRH